MTLAAATNWTSVKIGSDSTPGVLSASFTLVPALLVDAGQVYGTVLVGKTRGLACRGPSDKARGAETLWTAVKDLTLHETRVVIIIIIIIVI